MINSGIYPVVHTPMLEDESIDFIGLDKCLTHYASTEVTGLTILGSGGELPYLSDQEQLSIVEMAFQSIRCKMPIIVGVNAYSSAHAKEKAIAYAPYVNYILLMLNDYYGSSFDEYFRALEEIAKNSPKPILFYYFPQITGRYFSSTQLIRILGIENVIGIKDSSVHLPTARRILTGAPHTAYFTGLSLLLEKIIGMGGAGAICPIASVLPKQTSRYFHAIQEKHTDTKHYRNEIKRVLPIVNNLNLSADIQYQALRILGASPVPLLKSVASSHARIKEAIRLTGQPITAVVRQPLSALSNEEAKKIANIVASLQVSASSEAS